MIKTDGLGNIDFRTFMKGGLVGWKQSCEKKGEKKKKQDGWHGDEN